MDDKCFKRVQLACRQTLPAAGNEVENQHEHPHQDDAARSKARRDFALQQAIHENGANCNAHRKHAQKEAGNFGCRG